ncbi:MAG: EcoRV family type II restriction endonuclease [Synergistaceae bacterium]|nr:EcoRV family type II restriction endonuclease [Synergistaceae bacterium]
MKNETVKNEFAALLDGFAELSGTFIARNDEWTIKGFIDIFENIYTISADTKVISKILELHLFPHFLDFAGKIGYKIELASFQNWYPDLTFIKKDDESVKFAVDLKTTYLLDDYPGFCNGFTLGSHGGYFVNRDSAKNIQYPYNQYSGHFCLGIIYSRATLPEGVEIQSYSIGELLKIPSVINRFIFFAAEKWKIASDRSGSGNTANIGSIQSIDDILAGNGVFAKAGEEIFDDYWVNFGKIQVETKNGKRKALSSFEEYIAYRGLPGDIMNPRLLKKKVKQNGEH